MHGKKEFGKLASDFRNCRDVLIALGDENRLHSKHGHHHTMAELEHEPGAAHAG